MTALQAKLYSPLGSDDAPVTSTNDVKEHLADIQFISHKCANMAQSILDAANSPNKPVRSLLNLPETVPVSELTTIKALLQDIWQATVPLSGSVFFLASTSLLLRHRIHNITHDVARYLEAVCAELESWLGHDDDEPPTTPLTPVSMDSGHGRDSMADGAFAFATPAAAASSTPTDESAPPSHVSLVLDVMLALLEASSGMLAAMSRFRSEHTVEETKDRVSACLDRARFQEHMYHPEDQGMSAAYAEADRLGIKSLEAHVSGLTSYLWLDFGDPVF